MRDCSEENTLLLCRSDGFALRPFALARCIESIPRSVRSREWTTEQPTTGGPGRNARTSWNGSTERKRTRDRLIRNNASTSTAKTAIRMPGMSGLDLQAKLNAEQCPIPIIFITAHGDQTLRVQAVRGGAVKILAKPFDSAILLESVRLALEGEG
jgi:Response regulator receiver domain